MSIFRPSTWGISRVIKDINNYLSYIRILKEEKADPNSKFNKWDLQYGTFYHIFFTMDIEETEQQLPENIKRLRIIEMLAPLHRYLDEEIGLAGYITPEFNQFYEGGEPTLTYLIVYRFVFDKLSILWVLKWAFIIGFIFFMNMKYDFINMFIENISSYI